MKMYKLFTILGLGLSSLLYTQCGAVSTSETQETMTLSQPDFASSSAYFNSYIAGTEDGGTGIEFYIEISELPEDVVLEKLYFRESAGKLMRGTSNYVARFRTDTGNDQDIVMSDNAEEESVNTPQAQKELFPFPLSKNEAGVVYRDQGVLKYAKISNVQEKPSIAYPSQRPRGDGN